MVKVIRPEPGWAIVHWTGRIYIHTVSRTRREAVAAFVKNFVPRGKTWKTESEFGIHKAIKVEVILAGTALPSTLRGIPSEGK
jgi:hypothetical protein